MIEIKNTSVKDINYMIELAASIYEVVSEDCLGWEISTVADEILRLEIEKGDFCTDNDIAILRKLPQDILMISVINSHYIGDEQVSVYSPYIGLGLLEFIIEQINEVANDIKGMGIV